MRTDTQINSTRRKLLQSAASGAALLGSGLASLAIASEGQATAPLSNTVKSALPSCDLTIYQLQTSTSETVTLMNQTASAITIDELYPIGLSQPNGSLVVKAKLPNGPLTLQPGQRLSFQIDAQTNNARWNLNDQLAPSVVAGRARAVPNVIVGEIRVKSQHPAFNGVIPVTAFDAIPA